MPKARAGKTVTGEMVVKAPKEKTLNESNPESFILDHGRNVEKDYYRLQNRDSQLAAIESMSNDELAYIQGVTTATVAGNAAAAKNAIKSGIHKLHEQDMLELKALYYLHGLADTAPEYSALKVMTGGSNREEIARHLAEKQMKKLYNSQVEKILASETLAGVYATQMRGSAAKFSGLFGPTP